MEDEPPAAVPLGPDPHEDPSLPGRVLSDKVPITIITGFLGAGKTTLVNNILTQPHGRKIAVILNDFGDNLGIEKALVQDFSALSPEELGASERTNEQPVVEEWVEVGNGCICCSVKHSFVLALEQLLQRRDRFDYILLETTGLANPGPVISMLWVDEELESPLQLDSVVTVVDARNIMQQLSEGGDSAGTKLAQVQLAYADIVIVNKLDLVASDPEVVDVVVKHIRAINGSADIIKSERCCVDVSSLLSRQLFQGHGSLNLATSARGDVELRPELQVEIRSHHFSVSGEVDLKKLEAWLMGLLWEAQGSMDILRMKGAVCVPGTDRLKIFQAVKDLFDFSDGQQGTRSQASVNRVLVVGMNLDEDGLRAGFEKCLCER